MRAILIAVIAACGGGTHPTTEPRVASPVAAPPVATARAAAPEAVWTPLMQAARDGKLDRIDAELARGADLEASSPGVHDGATPFLIALHAGHGEAAHHLLRRGASHAGRLGTEGIALAAREGAVAVIDFLVARGVAVTGPRPLAMAAKFDHPKAIARLVAAGADVDGADRDDHDFTPLMVAAMENKVGAARALLDAGARTELVDDDGATALHWAVFGARPHEMHRYPVGGGPHDTTFTPQPSAPLVELLVARGAVVDAVERRGGNTPLHNAAMYDAAAAARVLVGAGASKARRNGDGKTALELATARNNSVIPIVR